MKKCFVPSCSSTEKDNKIFLTVPQLENIRKIWFEAAALSTDSIPKKKLFCCENHFNLEVDASNFMEYKLLGNKIFLKKDVVPHIFGINISHLSDSAKKRKRENQEKIEKGKVSKCLFPEIGEPSSRFITVPEEPSTSSSSPSKTSTSVTFSGSPTKSIDEDENLDDLNIKLSIYNIEKNPRLFLGLPKEEYFLVNEMCGHCHVTYRDILIILRKLRCNESFDLLGIYFNLNRSRISQIFSGSIPKVASACKYLIYWPDENTIKKLLPRSFRYRYSNCQSIIDCFEISIEQPTNAYNQAITWSNYKHANTAKYLISCTPFGLINFISEGFAGRTSDKEIVEHSGYLNKLSIGCTIMADRGFKHIESVLHARGCTLVRPASVPSGTKLDKKDAVESKRIAALRIHIERVIRRLREFHILIPNSCIDNKLIKSLDCILIICCAVVNMQGSLIK